MAESFSAPVLPTLSIIIPSYNRRAILLEALHSLAQQTYPSELTEVIVVDDGSTDDMGAITAEAFPFRLRLLSQENQGDAAARNLGARHSQANILVFLDDDILLEPTYLACLIQAHGTSQNSIVVGTWNLWQADSNPLSQTLNATLAPEIYPAASATKDSSADALRETITEVPFRDIYSNNMSVWREAFFKLGLMPSLDFAGSSMWCDLEFSYRAHQQGFRFLRSAKAICWHRDHAVRSLDEYKHRMRTAAYRAVVLFQKYPDLQAHLPMFYDKSPVAWGQDPPKLIARKIVRAVASTRLALWSLERIVHTLEKRSPEAKVLPPLYRYIIGGYVFQGFRAGLAVSWGQ